VFTARYVLHSTFCPHSVFMFCVGLNSDYFPTQCELMEKIRGETGEDIERYYIYIITDVNRNILL
jgi:hypothetical protein